MTVRHRRRRSLAVLGAVLVLGTTLLAPDAEARRKAKPRKAGKTPAAAATAPLRVAPMRFKVSTPNITQQLEIIPHAEGSVAFTLMIDGGCRRAVSGLASAGGEALTGQDEMGAAYAVTEYNHQGKDGCFLKLRIDAKQGKRATVAQGDCESPCPPIEDLMFRTVKK